MNMKPAGLRPAFLLRRIGRYLADRLEARRAQRKTVAMPSILTQYPRAADNFLPKPTAANLRRFAETPIVRRAINTIKDRIAQCEWAIIPKENLGPKEGSGTNPDDERIRILTENLTQPNNDDSFRSLCEQVLEDVIVGGFGAIELELTCDTQRPLNLYPVDGATIRMRADWDGNPESPRYTQITGKIGPEAQIPLNDDELIYLRLNPRTHTPFGLGRLEVAFETVNAFLGANRHAAKLASNSVVQYALWLRDLPPTHHERLIRWWQDDIEGTGRVPLLSTEEKPEVLRFAGGTDADLYLEWQQFLMRIIANAFDLPPFFVGLEHDVNRSTADAALRQAFSTAIVPTAKLFAEHITHDAIAKKLGWRDLKFVFTGLDAQDPRELAELHEILIRSGVMTVNEARAARGLQPLADRVIG
jgi:HK97 family phage portal protein